MHIKERLLAMLVVTLFLVMNLPMTAHASGLLDSAKAKASEVVDTIKENGPGWVESAKNGAGELYEAGKEKAGELYETGKEKLPELVDQAKNGLQNAQNQFSDWNAAQQDEFWQWEDRMLNGGTPNPTSGSTEDSVPDQDIYSQPHPPVSEPPAEIPPKSIDTPPAVSDTTAASVAPDGATQDSPTLGNTDIEPGDDQQTDPTTAPIEEFITYNGQIYRRVDEGGSLSINGKSYQLVEDAKISTVVNHSDNPFTIFCVCGMLLGAVYFCMKFLTALFTGGD